MLLQTQRALLPQSSGEEHSPIKPEENNTNLLQLSGTAVIIQTNIYILLAYTTEI